MKRLAAPADPAHRARGQVAVEFALSIGLVLTLLVGFFDLARGLAVQAAVSEMAWAGARFAAGGACLSNPRDEQPSTTTGEGSGGRGQLWPRGRTGAQPGTKSPARAAHTAPQTQ